MRYQDDMALAIDKSEHIVIGNFTSQKRMQRGQRIQRSSSRVTRGPKYSTFFGFLTLFFGAR